MVQNSGWWFRREATVGVAYMQDTGGALEKFVTVNETALTKWGSDIQALLQSGEIWLSGDPQGALHAEELLVEYASSTGKKILGIGASNGFCGPCRSLLLQEVGQQFLGQ